MTQMNSNVHQALSCVVQNITDFDYFDIKNIALTSKDIHDIILHTANIDTSKEHLVYVLLCNFLTYNVPNSQKCKHDVMGVKFVFKGRKRYLYQRNNAMFLSNEALDNVKVIGNDIEVLFSIGTAYRSNHRGTHKVYFGNTCEYHCIHINDIHKHRAIIKQSIINALINAREVDIFVHNTKYSLFDNFIIKLISILQDKFSIHTIHLFNENFLENVLLSSES